MKTFIRATEVWVLSHDGSRLELASGHYGELDSFRQVSESMSFAYDEGLPGKAWAYARPIILKHFEGSYFKRSVVARESGLTCGIALPVFSGDFIKAVVVFLCGDDAEHIGAVEVWHHDAATTYDMSLLDGYYGSAQLFEWRSAHTSFGKGTGLPGQVWEQNKPVLIPNLVEGTRFLRQESAVRVGLNKGIGLPFLQDPQNAYVVTLLSALGTPIARRFEIWAPDVRNTERLVFESGDCDVEPQFAGAYAEIGVSKGDGNIGLVWRSGIPLVGSVQLSAQSVADMNAQKAGLETVVVIPFIHQGKLNRIVSWYF